MPSFSTLRALGATSAVLVCAAACAADVSPKTAVPAGTCGSARFQPDLLQRVNDFRASAQRCGAKSFGPAAPLRWNDTLARLAFTHAQGMAARNEVEHTDAKGRGPADRATAAGYTWQVFAENVAGNYPGTAEVMTGWQASPGHCANLMNPAVSEVGVGCAPGVRGSAFKTYWAMELAKPR